MTNSSIMIKTSRKEAVSVYLPPIVFKDFRIPISLETSAAWYSPFLYFAFWLVTTFGVIEDFEKNHQKNVKYQSKKQ